jgi:hypothetical protein
MVDFLSMVPEFEPQQVTWALKELQHRDKVSLASEAESDDITTISAVAAHVD